MLAIVTMAIISVVLLGAVLINQVIIVNNLQADMKTVKEKLGIEEEV